jgi:ATP-dependent helicase/nuclease subunit A
VARMVALLATGRCDNISRLAAVTFTRKAAAELRARFRIGLEQEAASREGGEKQRLSNALADVDKCFIGTIHSFCARLLRERPVEAGVDLAFEELDDTEDARLRDEAWETFAAGLIVNDSDGILDEFDKLVVQLSDLKQAFIKYADYPDVEEWPAPVQQKKNPGLADKIKKILKYAKDMVVISEELPRDCGNDKLIPCYRIIPRVVNHYDDLEDITQLIDVLDQFNKNPKVVQKVWKESGKFTGDDAKHEQARWQKFQEEEVIPLINQIYENRYGLVLRVLKMACEVYDGLRASRGLLNYQDLLMKAAQLLRGQPHVREYFKGRFSHLLVDEFQDTDPIQAEVMMLLTASDPQEKDWRCCVPRPGSLFVVGDPKQSIYRFRRADIVTYNQVKRIIEKGDGKKNQGSLVELSANFRATREIIEWVNQVFVPKKEEEADEEVMLRFPGSPSDESPAYVPLQPGRIEGSAGKLAGMYCLSVPEDCSKKKEDAIAYDADMVARLIRHAVDASLSIPRSQKEVEQGKDKADYSDFMIITRNTTNLSAYAAALEKYGIPHQVTGGTALNEVLELKLLHTCLAAVTRPDDPVALVGALRSELFGISDAGLYSFKRASGRFSYNAAVPPGLDKKNAVAFSDSFARLKRSWRTSASCSWPERAREATSRPEAWPRPSRFSATPRPRCGQRPSWSSTWAGSRRWRKNTTASRSAPKSGPWSGS